MTGLVLLCWAAAVAVAARPLLAGRQWTRSAPRLAIGLWLAAELSVAVAVLTAGLLIAIPPVALHSNLSGILAACAQALASLGPADSALTATALAATGTLAGRLVLGLTVTFGRARRWRHRHSAALSPVTRRGEQRDSLIVDHALPVVYCLPGRPGRIVATRAALDVLSPAELAAVFEHERAHLRGRHHLLVAFAAAFHRAFPQLALAAAAEIEIRRLVEHLADDHAGRRHDRRLIATAIVRLADATPEHALGAATVAVDRVRRMLAPAVPIPAIRRLLAVTALGALLTVPPALAAVPVAVHDAACSHTTAAGADT